MNSALIELRGVRKQYGAVAAVAGVDLVVGEGELFGLIGHNGAGKTTLFRMMLGLVPATAGDIRIGGEAVRGEAFRRVRRGIGYLPESLALYDNLSGLETLRFFARLKGADEGECGALLERVGLPAAAGQRVRGYSKGMRQRLGFAQALLGQPRLLFLDEPTNGLDPQGIREFYEILHELRARGVTIVLTSHILAEIQQRVDRLGLMRSGRLQALGSVQALREAQDLPLTLELRCRPGSMAAVGALLAELALPAGEAVPAAGGEGDEAGGEGGGTLRVRCPRAAKMAVLGRLAGETALLADLAVHEPSLEEVFLGYTEGQA